MAIHVRNPRSDGRRRRSEASRRAIVAAMLALVREGHVTPVAEEVAARGKVGLRTVFRHFANMESLYREINAAVLAEVGPLIDKPYAAPGWRGRLAELMERRAALFERILPFKIASDVNRHGSSYLEAQSHRLVAAQRASLLPLLPRAVRADPLRVEALDLVLSFDSWRRLRQDQKLSPKRARAVIAGLVAKLVD